MADRLKDRVAIVVGAGSSGPGWGNGKCTAITFAREGAQVPPGRQGDRIWREIPPPAGPRRGPAGRAIRWPLAALRPPAERENKSGPGE